MSIEEYYSLGSCRVGRFTQLGILLQDLEKRILRIDMFSTNHSFFADMVLKMVSQTESFHPTQEQKEVQQNVSSINTYFIARFLENYKSSWSSKDFVSLPIVGPIISLFSSLYFNKTPCESVSFSKEPDGSQFQAHGLIDFISKKIIEEYQRLEEDIK